MVKTDMNTNTITATRGGGCVSRTSNIHLCHNLLKFLISYLDTFAKSSIKWL